MQKPQLFNPFLQGLLVFGSVLIFALPVFAGVSNFYKWTDDKGKVHFTDDPMKIPEQYRSGPAVKKFRGFPPPPPSPAPSAQGEPEKKSADSAGSKDEGDDKPGQEAGAKADESAVMQEALSFLKSDIARYKKYDDYIPQRRNAILLREEIVGALPAKEALVKKLEKAKSPTLQQAKSFLKQSLVKDYETKDHEHPRRLLFASERTRLQDELFTKTSLVASLEAELNSSKEKTQTSPAPPNEPEEKIVQQEKEQPKEQAAEEQSPSENRSPSY